ncbi:hypothetical protein BC833DRAFT_596217 [Globomyces pollinis-pini]|nr:hypothetical protein BC833DRAFT_596217 [Globomyces pollinis-pini]
MEIDPKLLQRRKSRRIAKASQHVNDFIRVNVRFPDGKEFPILADGRMSVEYLARQIEAETAMRYLIDQKTIAKLASKTNEEENILESEGGKLIDIYQLYSIGNLALPFGATIREALKFDDFVFPVCSDEEYLQDVKMPFKIGAESYFALNDASQNDISEDAAEIMDKRLLSVLHNTTALKFFNEFCLQEYSIENVLFWIEVEIYRTIHDDTIRSTFASHLYLTYIATGSPLGINISQELREEIPYWPDTIPDKGIYDDVQVLMYSLIKNHAYVRFEKSNLFKRFLEYKDKERYAYTQGKTIWDFDQLRMVKGKDFMKDMEMNLGYMKDPTSDESTAALMKIAGTSDDNSISSTFFRQKVLINIISAYFHEADSSVRGYFDEVNRSEYSNKQQRMHKQKKLTKFFGSRPDATHMQHQDTKGIDPSEEEVFNQDEATFEVSEDNDLESRKKKADKLVEFFGNSLPKKQLRTQNLIENSSVQRDESFQSLSKSEPGLDHDTDAIFLDNVNHLDPQQKVMLTKRAKKLLMMLGDDAGEKPVYNPQIAAILAKSEPKYVDDEEIDHASNQLNSVCITTEEPEAENPLVSKKQKLDKLSSVLGHRIETDELNTSPVISNTARPLTTGEKKIYQKKAGKLERLLGSTVPAGNIVHYDSSSLDNENEDGAAQIINSSTSRDTDNAIDDDHTESEDEMKRQKMMRLRKLRRMLGFEAIDVTQLTDKAIADMEQSVSSQIQNPEDRQLILDEIKSLKENHQKQQVVKSIDVTSTDSSNIQVQAI